MHEYTRAVFYYETDKMGVVHHSNYVRWMEEARMSFFNNAGIPYAETEKSGILSPVTNVNLNFKNTTHYGDCFTVRLNMTNYTGVRYNLSYTIFNQDGKTVAEAQSEHAFVSALDFKPVALSRSLPQRHEVMSRIFGGEVT